MTTDYVKKDTWWNGKNEPKTNPIYRGVASGEAGTNPISKQNMDNSLMITPLYCIPAYFIRKS